MIDSLALGVTLQVIRVLESLGIPYVIGGSLASSIHGQVRTTMDVDMIADIHDEHVSGIIAGLSDEFYVPDAESMGLAISNGASFNLIHLATMFKVDIFLPRDRLFERQQLSRRIIQTAGSDLGEPLWVLSPEDIILAKLDWYRAGGEISERQWRDALGVMMVQLSSLDIGYLKAFAQDLGVSDLLERALSETKSDTTKA